MSASSKGVGSVLPVPTPAETVAFDSVWSLWTSGFAHAAGFRTARAALAALLHQRNARRLWLPAYACDTVVPASLPIAWYATGPELQIDARRLETELESGDAVLLIDYFGRSPIGGVAAVAAGRSDILWIEDRAGALMPEGPAWAEVTLYSPRKLFGVADGGLMVADTPLPSPVSAADDADLWLCNEARARDPDGRRPEDWFPAFRAREAALTPDPLPMGRRTEGLLARLSWKEEAARRTANWRTLADLLPDYALWPECDVGFAPLAFPVVVENAATTAAALASERIWCARHWAHLPSPRDAFPEAHALAERCLSLPLDGRYDAADMVRVAEVLRQAARPAQPL